MKAGYIITNMPEEYKYQIDLASKLGWELHVGSEDKIDKEKYIFIQHTPETNFYKIADEMRMKRIEHYSKDGVVVDIRRPEIMSEEAFKPLPIPEKQKSLDDVALVMCGFFYNTDARIDALIKGIEQLKRLNPMPKIIFYEAGIEPILKDKVNADIYKFIEVSDKNTYIWQKEALFNLATQETDFKYYIFHDGDTFPDSPEWALYIKEILKENPLTIIQGGYMYEDTIYKNRSTDMYAKKKTEGLQSKFSANPGLSMSMTKETFEILGGWNTFLIAGSGDANSLCSWDKKILYKNGFENNCPWWELEVARNRKPFIDYIFAPYKLTHFAHGSYNNRGYFWRNKAIQWLGIRDIRKHVKIGDNGLIEWIGDQKTLKYILKNKPKLTGETATMKIIKEGVVQ